MSGAAQEVSLDQIAAWCGRAAHEMERADFSRPLQQVEVLLAAETKRNFDEGHTPDGTPWLPLKWPRANSRGGDKPLRDKGLLMASQTAQRTPQSLTYGTNLDYAAVHQWGATFPAASRARPWVFWVGGKKVFTRKLAVRTVPQRQFLGISPRLETKIGLIFADDAERRFLSA